MLRAPKSREGYAAIGGGSPLRRITNEQVKFFTHCVEFLFYLVKLCSYAFVPPFKFVLNLHPQKIKEIYFSLQAHALKCALEAKEISANVYVAMRYWYPFTEEAVQQVRHIALC